MTIATRKKIIIASALLLLVIMLMESAATFVVLQHGFNDMPRPLQISLAAFGFLVAQVAYIWLVYGYTHAFEDGPTRLVCLLGIAGLTVAGGANLVTSFMLFAGMPLAPFQQDVWIPWGGGIVFLGILLTVLLVLFVEPAVDAVKATGRAIRAHARR